jgi:hypothetical protein
MGKLWKRAEDLPVGATIKVGPGRYETVVAPSTVSEHVQTFGRSAGQKFTDVTIHTSEHDILTSLPCRVEIVD